MLFQSPVPPFSLILSFAFLGEVPAPVEMAAILVILAGVHVALRHVVPITGSAAKL